MRNYLISNALALFNLTMVYGCYHMKVRERRNIMDEKNNGVDKASRLYSTHGRKKFFGVPVIVNGRRALGYFEGDTIISYIYWKRPAIKYMVETCLYTSWTSKYMKHGYQRSMV